MTALSSSRGIGIQVTQLCKSFDGVEVLKNVTFSVAPGEIFVIMGPSGSGKSVLLKHIIGLLTPDSGEILIENQPVLKPDLLEKYRLAMVFQSSALLNSLTVEENIGIYLTEHRIKPPNEIKQIVADKLELLGLKGTGKKHTSELSGGMKKRVAIARALVMEPNLILYDEPTSELDPLIAVTIAEEILNLKRKFHVTSIVVTHDRDLAFGIADRVAMIYNGQLLEIGTPDELKQSKNSLVQNFLSVEFDLKHKKDL